MIARDILELLWSSTWQAWVLAVVVYTITRAAPRISPQFKSLLWSLVFVRLIIPPLFLLPTSAGAWGPDLYEAARNLLTQAEAAAPVDVAINVTHRPLIEGMAFSMEEAVPSRFDYGKMCILAWVLGVFCFFFLGAISHLATWRLIRSGSTPSRDIQNLFAECRLAIGLRKKVRLKIVQKPSLPMVCGMVRPIVILPATLAESLDRDELRSVFLHELMHVQRADVYRHAAEWFVCVLHFFNPVVWIARRSASLAREAACDDDVMLSGASSPRLYARSLLRVCEALPERPMWRTAWVAMAEKRSDASIRLKRVLDPSVARRRGLSPAAWAVVLITVGLLFTLDKPIARAARDQKTQVETAAPSAPESFEPPEKGKLEVRTYNITPPNRVKADEGLADSFFDTVVGMSEVLLYGREGRTHAETEGRRLYADKKKKEITVIDTAENLKKLERYLMSLPGIPLRKHSRVVFLDHTGAQEAVDILRREVPGVGVKPAEDIQAIYLWGDDEPVEEAIRLVNGFDVSIDGEDKLQEKTAVISLKHIEAESLYQELLLETNKNVEITLFKQRSALVVGGDAGEVGRILTYIHSIDMPKNQYHIELIIIAPGEGKDGHDAKRIDRDLEGRSLSSIDFLDSWEKMGWIKKIPGPNVIVLEDNLATFSIEQQVIFDPETEKAIVKAINCDVSVTRRGHEGEEVLVASIDCYLSEGESRLKDDSSPVIGPQVNIITMQSLDEDPEWIVVRSPGASEERAHQGRSPLSRLSHVFVRVEPFSED